MSKCSMKCCQNKYKVYISLEDDSVIVNAKNEDEAEHFATEWALTEASVEVLNIERVK